MNLGMVGCKRLVKAKTSRRLRPRSSMTRPTIMPMMRVAVILKEKVAPKRPMTPPSKKKEARRPAWNMSCGRTLSPSLAKVALMERTRPPTTAMQLESEAMIPIKKAVP